MLKNGTWVSMILSTNKQDAQNGFIGYKGYAQGGTIGFDVGYDNEKDLIVITYTKLDSKFKSNGGKLNTNVDTVIS